MFIGGVRIGLQLHPVGSAALGGQEGPGNRIAGEDGGGGPQLGAHVGDGRPFRHRQGGHAVAAVLDYFAHAAPDAQASQDLQDDILGAHPGGQIVIEIDTNNGRHVKIEGTAGHGHGHVQAAGADSQGAGATGRGGVAVGTEQRRPRHSEALQVDLVADAVPGAGKDNAVFGGDALQEKVVIGVFKAGLQGIMVDITDGKLGPHPRDAHGLQLQVSHSAGGVLGQGLIDAEGHFLAGQHFTGAQVLADYLLSKILAHLSSSSVYGM